MKRITALLLAVAFTLGSVCTAQADGVDIKVKGQWDFAFGWVNNKGFRKSANDSGNRGQYTNRHDGYRRDDDNFESRQRIRTQINFISSEYLQAVLMFEIGDIDWGRGGTNGRSSGGAIDADGVNIETKRAYLDWIIPQTEVSVRMGIQGLKLPSNRLGNPVFDADVAGVVVSSPVTDWLALTAFWIRPFDTYRNDSDGAFQGNDNWDDEVDVFGIVAPLSFDGFSISPYFMYGFVGANSGMYNYMFSGSHGRSSDVENSSAKAWWLGGNFTMDLFDPLTLSIDGIYGHLQRAELFRDKADLGTKSVGASGWFISATLDYKLDWGTPGIFGWYASGDDKNADHDGQIGRLPVLGTDGGFTATTFGTAGYYGIGNGGNAAGVTNTGTGTWGVGIQIADVSFIDDLSHTLRVAYYRGTNDSELVEKNGGFEFLRYDSDAIYLTDDDSVIEVNFDHTYQIYENLEACLELGYMHLKTDKGTWGYSSGVKEKDNAWKAEVNLRYSF